MASPHLEVMTVCGRNSAHTNGWFLILLLKNSELVWEWYQYRRRIINDAEPNSGHRAFDLEKYLDVTIITQNVDTFHYMAVQEFMNFTEDTRNKCTMR